MKLLVLLLTITHSWVLGHGTRKDLGTVIGIDLGTTYSCVGIFKNCHVEIIENDNGNRITPSCVSFAPDGERFIGDAAKNLLTTNPSSKIVAVFPAVLFLFCQSQIPFFKSNASLVVNSMIHRFEMISRTFRFWSSKTGAHP